MPERSVFSSREFYGVEFFFQLMQFWNNILYIFYTVMTTRRNTTIKVKASYAYVCVCCVCMCQTGSEFTKVHKKLKKLVLIIPTMWSVSLCDQNQKGLSCFLFLLSHPVPHFNAVFLTRLVIQTSTLLTLSPNEGLRLLASTADVWKLVESNTLIQYTTCGNLSWKQTANACYKTNPSWATETTLQ